MSQTIIDLKIVKVKENLGKGEYLAQDVFSQEKITIKLTGKQRMNYSKLGINTDVYISVQNSDFDNAKFIIWKYNTNVSIEKQKKELESRYLNLYSKKLYQR